MKKIYILILFIFHVFYLKGQKTHTVQQLLGSSGIDENNPIHSLLQEAQNKSNAVEKLEFRTETNQWDLNRQEYTFRTSLRGKEEISTEKKIWNIWDEMIAIEDYQYYIEDLHALYQNIISVIFTSEKLDVYAQLLAVLEDKNAVFKEKARMGGAPKPIDVLKNQSDEIELKSRILRSKQQLIGYKSTLEIGEKDVIDDTELLPVEELHVSLLENILLTNDLESKIQELKVEKSVLELKKEEAEAKRILDFVQLKYSDRPSYSPGDQISIGVGIVLPTGNQNRDNIVEARIDLYREEKKLEALKHSKIKEDKSLETSYISRYYSYLYKKKEIENLELEKKIASLSKLDEMDANSLLDIKILSLKRRLDLIDDEYSLMEKYLELLFQTGLCLNYDLKHLITRK